MIYTLFHVLVYSGMRKGEALALTWGDINFEDNEIRINKAISRGRDCQLYLKTTKIGVVRTISMDQQSMNLLAIWRAEQAKSFETKSPKKQLVFNNRNNNFIQPVQTQKWLQQIFKKFDFPIISTHGLRHTLFTII